MYNWVTTVTAICLVAISVTSSRLSDQVPLCSVGAAGRRL